MSKILIDLRYVNWTGIGRLSRSFVSGFSHLENADLKGVRLIVPESFEVSANLKSHLLISKHQPFSFRGMLELEYLVLRERLSRGIDLYCSFHFIVPVFSLWGTRLSVNLYDDLTDSDEFRNSFHRIIYKLFISLIVKKSQSIVFQSRLSLLSHSRRIGRLSDRPTAVLYPAVSVDYWLNLSPISNHRSPSRPFFLYIGLNKPRKNLGGLVSAFKDLVERFGRQVDLLMVGPDDKTVKGTSWAQLKSGWEDRIKFLGYVDDNNLKGLITDSVALVVPSYSEGGFSYPAAEAIVCGARRIILSHPDMAELTHPTVVGFDVNSDWSLVNALEQACLELEKGSERCRATGLIPDWVQDEDSYVRRYLEFQRHTL